MPEETPHFYNTCLDLGTFHPQPQIASDLGRNVTRNSNPHLKSQAIPEQERHFWLMAADFRAATLQKCGSEDFLRFSLPKVS